MRRLPAAFVLATVVMAGCRVGEVRTVATTPVPGLPSAEPLLEVGIVVSDTAAWIGADSAFDLFVGDQVFASVAPNTEWRFAVNEAGELLGGAPNGGAPGSPVGAPVRIVARDGNLRVGGTPYRGHLMVIASPDSGVTVVNVVALETYLRGVVPLEIGSRPPEEVEAVKAQAVAARTYAIANIGSRHDEGFDVYATVFDQVYGGMDAEDPVADRAILETRGQLILHGGRPIIAYYSSTCGGRTAAIEEAWPWMSPLPYLKSVSDRIPGTDRYYCDISNRWSWTTRWTRAELLAVLGETLRSYTEEPGLAITSITRVAMTSRNASERVSIDLEADDRTYHLRADSLRWVLRPEPGPRALNSAVISDIRTDVDSGQISVLEIHGSGWGHGVGMCQVGAWGRARAGQSYREILTAYYRGVEIRRLY